MSISFKDITVVVQGPVSVIKKGKLRNNWTELCLASISRVLPGAHIILSTWEGEDVSGLNYHHEVIFNEDPGSIKYEDASRLISRHMNVNRQIKSTLAGLKKVKTPYAIKLRTDNILLHTNFLQIYERFQRRYSKFKILNHRVISSSWFTRNPHTFLAYPYHPSDLFFFGETEDLLNIWDIPLADETMFFYFRHRKDPGLFERVYECQFSPEQFIWISFLRKNGIDVKCDYYCDVNAENLKLSELSIVNNLFLAHPKAIGFSSLKHNANFFSIDTLSTVYTNHEYLVLYKQYCDPCLKLEKTGLKRLVLMICRCLGYSVFLMKVKIKQYVPLVDKLYQALKN